MKKESVFSPLFIARAGMIAALYVVLTMLFAPISFKEVQVRISEALTILPLFTPAAIPGLFVGCLISNILGGCILWDIIFGSIAMILRDYLNDRKLAATLQNVCLVLMAVAVLGRLFSGVHWLTDILGGLFLSFALLQAFSGAEQNI